MDGVTQMIVDLLRRGKENAALRKGGPVAGMTEADALLRQRPRTPAHQGRSYDDVVTRAERG